MILNKKGQLVALDYRHHQIRIFSDTGELLQTIGREGSKIGELWYPSGIGIQKNGTMVVCEYSNSRIQFFDEKGESLRMIEWDGVRPSIGLPPPGDLDDDNQSISFPTALVLTTEEDIILSDDSNRIRILNLKGELLKIIRTQNADAFGLTILNCGRFVSSDYAKPPVQLGQLSDGTLIKQVTAADGIDFYRTQGVTSDREDKIIIADGGNNRIIILNSEGEFLWSLSTRENWDDPGAVMVDWQGNLFVGDSTKIIKLYN